MRGPFRFGDLRVAPFGRGEFPKRQFSRVERPHRFALPTAGEQSAMPSQQGLEQPLPFDPRAAPDIRALDRIAHRQLKPPHEREVVRVETIVAGCKMIDFSGKIAVASTLQIVLFQNLHRKRFIIINPDSNATTLYFSFNSSPQSLIPLVPGAIWDESGSAVATDEIYVQSATVASPFGAYEGTALPPRRHKS